MFGVSCTLIIPDKYREMTETLHCVDVISRFRHQTVRGRGTDKHDFNRVYKIKDSTESKNCSPENFELHENLFKRIKMFGVIGTLNKITLCLNSQSSLVATSIPGSLSFSSFVVGKRDPGCGWSRDHPNSGW